MKIRFPADIIPESSRAEKFGRSPLLSLDERLRPLAQFGGISRISQTAAQECFQFGLIVYHGRRLLVKHRGNDVAEVPGVRPERDGGA